MRHGLRLFRLEYGYVQYVRMHMCDRQAIAIVPFMYVERLAYPCDFRVSIFRLNNYIIIRAAELKMGMARQSQFYYTLCQPQYEAGSSARYSLLGIHLLTSP